ncbi:MAG: histidine phosphatase family protein [Alphaproteobacteria bacterium]|nr:histidine phosphatase family protein [Alphaproteobacteria bacterium]
MADSKINLYLVRHGETEGNINRRLYQTKADHAIRLTERGVEQAESAGNFLANHLLEAQGKDPEHFGKIRVWYSPYYRARETAFHVLRPLGRKFDHASGTLTYREDPFLFEQKAGLFDGLDDGSYTEQHPNEAADYQKHIDFNGRVYAKSPLGESRIDIVIRVKHFFGTLLDDWRKHDIRHAVIINHGVTVRAITMGWMRYAPEWLEAEKNPGNCWIRHIHGDSAHGYRDEGYIFGERAPIRDIMATQRTLDNAEDIYLLKPGRPNGIIPPGVNVKDPFAEP